MSQHVTCAKVLIHTPHHPPGRHACTSPQAPPPAAPPLTLLPHAAFQALAQAAGLALPPRLPGDLAGALPEGAPQPGIAFHGPPVREPRPKVGCLGAHCGPLCLPTPGTLVTPSVGPAFASVSGQVHRKGSAGVRQTSLDAQEPGGRGQGATFPATFTLVLVFQGVPVPRATFFSSRPQFLPPTLAPHSCPLPLTPSVLLGTPGEDLGDMLLRRRLFPGFLLLGRGSQRKPVPRVIRNIRSPFFPSLHSSLGLGAARGLGTLVGSFLLHRTMASPLEKWILLIGLAEQRLSAR